MEWRPPADSAEDTEAFERIDVLLANAAHGKTAEPPRRSATPPVERILAAVETLLLIRTALAQNATVTPVIRTTLEHVLNDIEQVCDEWEFSTAHVRVDFTRDDLRNGLGDIEHDVLELVRHLRYDAKSWNPNRAPRRERRYQTHPHDRAVAADRGR